MTYIPEQYARQRSSAGLSDYGGFAEALVALHRPTKCFGGGAKLDTCRECHSTWPCETLRLLCGVLGTEPPEQQMTGCDGMRSAQDGDGWIYCTEDRGHEPNGCTPWAIALGIA